MPRLRFRSASNGEKGRPFRFGSRRLSRPRGCRPKQVLPRRCVAEHSYRRWSDQRIELTWWRTEGWKSWRCTAGSSEWWVRRLSDSRWQVARPAGSKALPRAAGALQVHQLHQTQVRDESAAPDDSSVRRRCAASTAEIASTLLLKRAGKTATHEPAHRVEISSSAVFSPPSFRHQAVAQVADKLARNLRCAIAGIQQRYWLLPSRRLLLLPSPDRAPAASQRLCSARCP